MIKHRVLFAIPSLNLGGAERVVASLLQRLPRDRFTLELALVERVGPFLSEIPEDVVVHDLGARRVRYAMPKLCALIRRVGPAIVVSNLNYLNLATLLLRPLIPRETGIIVQETTTLSAHLKEMSWSSAWERAYRWLYPKADGILCCSDAMGEDLETRFNVSPERIRRIPNPIDADAIEQAAQTESSPFQGRGPHILAVGRLDYEKGYDRLIQSFQLLHRRIPDAELWILGDGSCRAELESLAEKLDVVPWVHLMGYVANPFSWMHHADVFVQSSRREGLPVAVLEAVACGAPVAAFDCPGGTREILDGLSGTVLVPDGDIEALAAAIERLARGSEQPSLPERYRMEVAIQSYADALAEFAAAASNSSYKELGF